MVKNLVIFFLSLGLTLTLLGTREAKAGEVSLRATCKIEGNLAICSMAIKNIGSEPLYVNPHHFFLITQEGASHPYTIGTYTDYGYFLSKNLSPKEEAEGKLGFQVFGEPEYLVFDDGWGTKAKASLTGEVFKEGKGPALTEIRSGIIYQEQREDLRTTLSEKNSQIAFLEESLTKLGDELIRVKERDGEEIESLRIESESKKELLSKCQEETAKKEDITFEYQEEPLEETRGQEEDFRGSKLLPFIFFIGAAALIVAGSR